MRESELHFLARAAESRDVRKEYGAREDLSGAFFVRADHAQRKRRPRLLFVAQFEFGEHRLLGENVLGHVEFQVNASEHRARKDTGNQDAREGTRQDHEQQIVSGVDGSENQNRDDAEVNHSLAREAVVNLIDHPAEAGASREIGHDGDRHPCGQAKSDDGGDGGEQDAALLRDGGGKKRDQQRRGEHQHGDAEIAPAGLVARAPHAENERIGHRCYTGTRVESRISPRMVSACSDFFCVEM